MAGGVEKGVLVLGLLPVAFKDGEEQDRLGDHVKWTCRPDQRSVGSEPRAGCSPPVWPLTPLAAPVAVKKMMVSLSSFTIPTS